MNIAREPQPYKTDTQTTTSISLSHVSHKSAVSCRRIEPTSFRHPCSSMVSLTLDSKRLIAVLMYILRTSPQRSTLNLTGSYSKKHKRRGGNSVESSAKNNKDNQSELTFDLKFL